MSEQLFVGLFQRLHGSGLHPALSGELAAANYPNGENQPLRAVRCRQDAVHWHTEAYLDQGTSSLEETWLSIWGVTPLEYMGVAAGSPAATELGLGASAPSSGAAHSVTPTSTSGGSPAISAAERSGAAESPANTSKWWLMYGHSESVLERYSGRHLPASATPNARYFADVMTMVASGIASMVDDNRKGKKVAGFYRKSPPGWWADLEGVAVAMCIFMLTAETSSTLLVSGDVGDHYRGLLGQVAPDLRQLVAVESDEPGKDGAAMLAKLGRITSELADKRRVKLKADMLELGLVVLPGAYVGSRRGGASMAVDLDHPDFTLDHALAIVADVG